MFKYLAISALAAAVLASAPAHAVTFGFSEGKRDDVDGTTRLSPTDVNNSLPGPLIATIGLGDEIEIYGRIVDAADNYQFTATSSFIIEWIFEGYTTDNGAVSVVDSGFVQHNSSGSTTIFTLFNTDNPQTAVQGPFNLSTDLTAALGSQQQIFGVQGPGTYSLQLDGLTDAALYDIRIQAVPLPAPILLLMAGVAGLAAVSRRKAA